MKKNIFILPLFISLSLFSQNEEDYINWSPDRKLVWDNFKATPQKNIDAAALTATHLGFSYQVINNKITYTIDCRFEKKKSWGISKNNWILNHEQGHFDIAEIFSRKLFKAISAYTFNKNTFQNDLDSIYKKIMLDKEKFQQLYDAETENSRNKPKQEEWLKKIEQTLIEFNAWSEYANIKI